jgi:hypothetical protein
VAIQERKDTHSSGLDGFINTAPSGKHVDIFSDIYTSRTSQSLFAAGITTKHKSKE